MSEEALLSEDENLAAEHALGLLTAAERASVETRMAREPAFAAEVEAWRYRFAPLADRVGSVAPSQDLWARLERALPANDNVAFSRKVRFWRGTAGGALALAAASLVAAVMFGTKPPVYVQPPTPGPLLNASLDSQSGGAQPLFIAAYDPMRKAVIITSLLPRGADPLNVHQLWLIPGDGKPRSLGFIEPGQSKVIALPQRIQGLAGEGAALAVSLEAPGGSTDETGPRGPVTAVGKLEKI